MNIRRIVPDISSSDPEMCRSFYGEFLGLNKAMDLGWVATYVSATNPTAQVTIVRDSGLACTPPAFSIEVDDVDQAYREANERGIHIVYPITTEPWGVRRFFVSDPNGKIVNILSHVTPIKSNRSTESEFHR